MGNIHGTTAARTALSVATAELRAAAAALRIGMSPQHPDWQPSEEREFEMRFERWRAASRQVVAALEQLASETRRSA